MSEYFVTNIETDTLANSDFRHVIYTTDRSQLVLMSLKPLEDIGMETHEDVDQFIRIEKGNGVAILNGKVKILKDGSAVVIPAGTEHNIINTNKTKNMKLYTIYTPPEHPKNTIIHNKPNKM